MPEAPFKHIAVAEFAGAAIVEFVNSKLMFANEVVQEIGDELGRLITSSDPAKIVLDFRNVQYLSSMMLARLAKLQQQVDESKGQLKICGLGPILKDTFRIGHFDRVFDIHDDVASAIKAIR
jgi:anti-sigma B factor antagonist